MTADLPIPPSIEPEQPVSELNLDVELAPGTRLIVHIRTHTAGGITLEERSLELNGEMTAELPALPPNSPPEPAAPAAAKTEPLVSLLNLRRWAASGFQKLNASLRTQSMNWLIGAAVLIYAITRLVGIADFPIYFFTDEAVQTVLAADFVRDGYRSYDKELLPTYFENGGQYEMNVSVYVQVLPYLIFGKNEAVTRGVSALITIIAALAVGLTLKNIFGSPYAWSAVLVLSTVPTWFLHSRTAFETAIATAFYGGMLYCYLMYRKGELRWLYGAVVFSALTFYSYSPGQLVTALALLLLLISDWRYHWQNKKVFLRALGLGLLFLLPYIRFLVNHPIENANQLKILNSYWIHNLTLPQKLGIYFSQLIQGLNPLYWFLPHDGDLVRHVMRGYGHFLPLSLPFALLGIGMAVRFFKESRYRTILIGLLAAPAGAAMVDMGITRSMFIVIPYTLLIALGLSAALSWLERWFRRSVITVGIFLLLAAFNFYMLRDALTNGPLWYSDYTLSGMQYGAKQLFTKLNEMTAEQPNLKLIVSPSWANGTDTIARFFSPDPLPYTIGSIDGYLYEQREISPDTLFVMIPDEFDRARASGKFTDIQVTQTIPYPNGQPGFYFIKLRYVDNIQQILEQENLVRKALKTDMVSLSDGQTAQVSYSALDMGEIGNLFDGDQNSLLRTLEANPFKMQVKFAQTRALRAVTVRVGGTPTRVTLRLPDGQPYSVEVGESPEPRDVRLQLDPPQTASEVTIEVLSINDSEPAHVHVWEVQFE